MPSSLGLKTTRVFSQTAFLSKKGSKTEKKESRTEDSKGVEDPYDFSALETGIGKALEKLSNDLSKLRTGGRFNPEVLEAVKIHLSKDSKASIALGELAQVLPKGGRSVSVLVGEVAVGALHLLFKDPCQMHTNLYLDAACQADYLCHSEVDRTQPSAPTGRARCLPIEYPDPASN